MKAYFHMSLLFIFATCLFCPETISAQQPETIRVRKESDLVKAYFDASELKLIPIDRFGNPQENKIMGFKLYVKNKRETKAFESFTCSLNNDMINYLNGLSSAAKIFFTEIVVQTDENNVMKLPDVIDVWFPKPTPNKGNRRR